jgi:hypothetical protein
MLNPIQNNIKFSVGDVKRLVRYMQNLVSSAKGNVTSFTLKQAKRALGMESKSEETMLKGALETLVSLGLLQKAPGKKPRYLLQRGSPLWNALEQGCTDLLTALMDRYHKNHKTTPSVERGQAKGAKN